MLTINHELLIDQFDYSKLNKENGPQFDPAEHFIRYAPIGLEIAEMAAERADSYRGFNVGSVILAHDPVNQTIATLVSWNDKPTEFLRKRCGEMKGLQAAVEIKHRNIIGAYTQGTDDINLIRDVTRVPCETLHPCNDCLYTLDFYQQSNDLRVTDALPVMTSTHSAKKVQLHTFGELKKLHNVYDDPEPDYRYDPAEYTFSALTAPKFAGAAAIYKATRGTDLANVSYVDFSQRMRNSLQAA